MAEDQLRLCREAQEGHPSDAEIDRIDATIGEGLRMSEEMKRSSALDAAIDRHTTEQRRFWAERYA
ncbi:MAG: hypothetical protein WC520_00630 [Candidatus Paceibacterota bacterium]